MPHIGECYLGRTSKKRAWFCSLFLVAEPPVQCCHRLIYVLDVTRLEIINVSADLAATDLVRFGIVHIAGLEKLSIVLQRSFHLAHVTKTREFQRIFEMTRLRIRFTDCGKHTTELFIWSQMQILVADKYAIGPPCEFLQPFVHRLNHQRNAENRIAQNISHSPALELISRLGSTSRHFNIVRNERVPGIAREQNNPRSLDLARRDQEFAPDTFPPTRLCVVFVQIVRIDNPRYARVVVRFGMKRERVFVTSANIGAEKGSYPGATAIRDRNDDRVAA